MELRQIKYFIEVAKREHVTDAANHLHVAQSAVSRQIAKLEEELGVSLFIREGRNVRLTPIGEIFLKHMEQAIHVIEDAEQVIHEYTDPEKGTIHIGFVSTLALYILPTLISAFRRNYPEVKFKLIQGNYYELKNYVLKGKTNMALLAPVPVDEARLQGKVLSTEKVVALLPLNHPKANQRALQLTDLREESFIMFPEGFILRRILVQACEQVGFTPKVTSEGDDIDALKGLVSAGLGISLVPESTLVDNQPRATVRIPLIDPVVTRTVGMIIPADRELLPTEKIFYEFVVDFFSRLEQFKQ
ncbi:MULTISPECIES: LysR family transcriptional regulator [unclassified Oceanobacillus]|uniref:LysR family transcriptional regulator n=1 Tax=unclassified Oceanobacillus TaxID=2630292 RepID=UPI00300E0717